MIYSVIYVVCDTEFVIFSLWSFVELMLARFACMCPFNVDVGFGGQRRICLVVISGNVVK